MFLLGCTPRGRFTEQHDVFFSIGPDLKSMVPDMVASWPEANGKIHIDAWRELTCVEGHQISVISRTALTQPTKSLFFLNLGGYKPDLFEELHYKMVVVAETKAEAIRKGKESAFYKHTGFKGATSHIDDKYGIDVDDIFQIDDVLPKQLRKQFALVVQEAPGSVEDSMHLGYLQLKNIK